MGHCSQIDGEGQQHFVPQRCWGNEATHSWREKDFGFQRSRLEAKGCCGCFFSAADAEREDAERPGCKVKITKDVFSSLSWHLVVLLLMLLICDDGMVMLFQNFQHSLPSALILQVQVQLQNQFWMNQRALRALYGTQNNCTLFVFLLTRYTSNIETISGDFPLYPFWIWLLTLSFRWVCVYFVSSRTKLPRYPQSSL